VVHLPGTWEAIGRLIKDNTYFIVLAALILIAIGVVYAGKIYMATGTETLVFKDTQIYKDIEYYDEHFQSTYFLILLTSDDVYDPRVLDAMDDMERQILANPKVENVTGLQTLVRQAYRQAYGREGLPDNQGDIERLLAAAPMSSMLVPNEHHTIMMVELKGTVEEKDEPSVLEDIKQAIQWSPMPPGTSAVVTGKTAMMLEVQQEMMRSMMVMMATAIVFMVIALWLTFGHASWRLLPLPIVLAGIVYTAGIMGLTGIPLTMVSMAVFPILIGLGVEYAIQFQNRMMEELGSGRPPGDAVVATVRNIGPPLFYSMLTTCLGFLSILQSPIPMIYDFGLMCLIGIVVCFLTALFLLTSVIYGMARLGGVKLGARRHDGPPGEGHQLRGRGHHEAAIRGDRCHPGHGHRVLSGSAGGRGDRHVDLRAAGPAVGRALPHAQRHRGVQDERHGRAGQGPGRDEPRDGEVARRFYHLREE